MLLVVLAGAAASAQSASLPQPVSFEASTDVLDGLQADTGWWPSANGPLSIRFYITSIGGVSAFVEGESELQWDDVDPRLRQRVHGVEGSVLELDSAIEIGSDVRIDVGGVFTGVVPLAANRLELVESAPFDTLLLPGQPATAEVGKNLRPATLSFNIDVLPTVDLVVGVEATPRLSSVLVGRDVQTETEEQLRVQSVEGQWSEWPPTPGGAAELGVVSTWRGDLDTALELVLSPELELFTPVGNFDLVRFDIPVPLQDRVDLLVSDPVFYVHPLPWRSALPEEHDFGSVLVGQTVQWALPIENLGELTLLGEWFIEGDDAFSVFPDGVVALPDGDDGVVISFVPNQAGAASADLVLVTNDPSHAEHRIRLIGNGAPPDGGVSTDQNVEGGTIRTCGCAATEPVAPIGMWTWLATLGLLGVRRFRVGRRYSK